MIDSGIPELNNIDNLKKLHEKFVPQKNRQEASNYMLDNLRESVDAMMPVFMEKSISLLLAMTLTIPLLQRKQQLHRTRSGSYYLMPITGKVT